MSRIQIAPPTLAGFLTFIRGNMGINTTVLPDDAPVIPMAFQIAMDLVNCDLNIASPDIYTLAVYNLGGDNIINFAPDVQPPVPYAAVSDNPGDLPFFQYLRSKWKLLDFNSGVVQSTGDEGTNVSLVVQEAAKNFTIANLQQLKTPWGRQYLSFAQSYGPTIWGLS